MSLDSARVIWSEGLFLRPHHFQQLERYLESLVQSRLSGTEVADYGFLSLQINTPLLLQGKVGLVNGTGVLPDGTPFDVTSEVCDLKPFDVTEALRGEVLYLTAMLRHPGVKTVSLGAGDDPAAARTRYTARDVKVADSIAGFDGEADLKVGALQLSIGPRDSLDGLMTSMPFARIVERRADGGVVLDDKFVPPLLDIAAHPRTRLWLDELLGIVRQRADSLAEMVVGSPTLGVGDSTDFLLLLLCNRYDPLLAQMRNTRPLHPRDFFNEMLKLAGECATFGRENRRVPALPAYAHGGFAECFEPVYDEIRAAILQPVSRNAVRIVLREVRPATYLAEVNDPLLISNGFFILAATSQDRKDLLRIPTQVKIGPTDKLMSLVDYNLPGIPIEALQSAPRQIPNQAKYTYYRLDSHSAFWKAIEESRRFGLYVAGEKEMDGLEMHLWAIRQ